MKAKIFGRLLATMLAVLMACGSRAQPALAHTITQFNKITARPAETTQGFRVEALLEGNDPGITVRIVSMDSPAKFADVIMTRGADVGTQSTWWGEPGPLPVSTYLYKLVAVQGTTTVEGADFGGVPYKAWVYITSVNTEESTWCDNSAWGEGRIPMSGENMVINTAIQANFVDYVPDCVIEPGSLWIHPNGELQLGETGTLAILGSLYLYGSLSLSPTEGDLTIVNGDWHNYAGSTFNHNGVEVVFFNETDGESIIDGDTNQTLEFAELTVNINHGEGYENPGVLRARIPLRINGELRLWTGMLEAYEYDLTMGEYGSFTPMLVGPRNMVILHNEAEGKTGRLILEIRSDMVDMELPIGTEQSAGGTETYYSPLSLNCTMQSHDPGAYLSVQVRSGEHPELPSYIILDYLSRYWRIEQKGMNNFSCSATFYYVAPHDVVGNEANIYPGYFHCCVPITGVGYWSRSSESVDTSTHSFCIQGIVRFSDFTGVPSSIPVDVPLNIYHLYLPVTKN